MFSEHASLIKIGPVVLHGEDDILQFLFTFIFPRTEPNSIFFRLKQLFHFLSNLVKGDFNPRYCVTKSSLVHKLWYKFSKVHMFKDHVRTTNTGLNVPKLLMLPSRQIYMYITTLKRFSTLLFTAEQQGPVLDRF